MLHLQEFIKSKLIAVISIITVYSLFFNNHHGVVYTFCILKHVVLSTPLKMYDIRASPHTSYLSHFTNSLRVS